MNTNELQYRVEKMLQGERKRREYALRWLKGVTGILVDVAPEIWGSGDHAGDDTAAVWVVEKRNDGKWKPSEVYFRYAVHEGETKDEMPGFYSSECDLFWGRKIESARGSDFWHMIGIVVEFISFMVQNMDARRESREKLLAKLRVIE